ncbi:MAG TPA: hypothetical protein DCQ39_00330 [Lachnospiraceae bacterium]|nr:hypothetical protein [Lachnospiraceae bacterium]
MMKQTDAFRQELLMKDERALVEELLWAAAGKSLAAGFVLCVFIAGIWSQAAPGAVPLWKIIFAVLSLSVITGVSIRFIQIQKKL